MRAALACLLLLCACRPEPAATAFPLRDVVAPALAELAPASAPIEVPVAAEPLPEELAGMLDTLGSQHSPMREAVLEDLRQRGDACVGHLARALADPESSDARKAAAIHGLAALDTPLAAEVLVRTLTSDRTAWIRAQCAWRLADSQQDRFLPRLLLRLKYEPDDETAVWLADCLAKRGNYAGVDGVRVVRDRARTSELAALASEHLASLAAAAGVADGDALAAQWSSGALEARSPGPAPSRALEFEAWKCIEGLAQWDLRVVDDRRFALSHSSAWVVPLLARTLHERSVYLRIHAAQCLERMGPRASAAGAELIAALGEPRVAPAAAAALGALRHAPACEALEQALGAGELELACAAARALGALGEPRSLAPLRAAFASEAPIDLRQAAAESLLALDAADVVRFLAERMTAPRAESIAAENALGAWLARRAAAGADGFAERLAQWRALDPVPAGEIATREQTDARLAARAALAQGF